MKIGSPQSTKLDAISRATSSQVCLLSLYFLIPACWCLSNLSVSIGKSFASALNLQRWLGLLPALESDSCLEWLRLGQYENLTSRYLGNDSSVRTNLDCHHRRYLEGWKSHLPPMAYWARAWKRLRDHHHSLANFLCCFGRQLLQQTRWQ